MGARGHHGTHQLNAPALGILLVLPFPEAREGWEMSRENAPHDDELLSGSWGFPHWLHLRLGLHSIFRLQGSRCFSGLSACLPPVSNTIREIW